MAIYRLAKGAAFEPEQLHVLGSAYEGLLVDLNLKDRDDPLTEVIAKKLLDRARRGENDAIRLRKAVLEEITCK